MDESSMNDSIILKNNPFVAPADGRCIINDLPAELLSQIFVIGAECHCEESKGDGDDDSYTDSLSELVFATTLCSTLLYSSFVKI